MRNGTTYNRRVPRSSGRRTNQGVFAEILSKAKVIKTAPDYLFLGVVVLLLTYGVIMLYSASSGRAYSDFGDSLWYIKRHLLWMAVGVVAMVACSRIDYHVFEGRAAGLCYIGGGLLLIAVLLFGTTINGAKRWLFGIQPSEIAKLAIIILFSYKLSRDLAQKEIKSLKKSFIPYMFLLALYLGLLLLQPHFSCALLIGATACLLLLVAGTPIKYFVGMASFAIPLGIIAVIAEPYRLQRILNFADPFADLQGGGWQVAQSLYAIGSGGLFGVGLGNSRQKFQSLPEPQNDFIFSVLCEELGLLGAVLLIALFAFLLIRGIKIALNAPDLFGTLLVVGFVGIVMIQAMFNIAVVTATVPNTGVPLPFFSYGGTALVVTMAEMGIVLNVSRQTKMPI